MFLLRIEGWYHKFNNEWGRTNKGGEPSSAPYQNLTRFTELETRFICLIYIPFTFAVIYTIKLSWTKLCLVDACSLLVLVRTVSSSQQSPSSITLLPHNVLQTNLNLEDDKKEDPNEENQVICYARPICRLDLHLFNFSHDFVASCGPTNKPWVIVHHDSAQFISLSRLALD